MTHTSVIGLQWGDEAKGKMVDLLTSEHDVVVRYQGGNNAGHTVKFGGNTYKLSLVPAGVLHPGKISVLGPGVVINPEALLKELAQLNDDLTSLQGRFWISDRAHVIFPWHIAEESARESDRGGKAIGTTGRGIGTCYAEKIARSHAIRIGDLIRPEFFKKRLEEIVPFKNRLLSSLIPDFEPFQIEPIYKTYSALADQIRPVVTNTTALLQRLLADGKQFLFEGAQGGLLDIDHGTFPYVTSSNSSAAGLHSGSGVPGRVVDRMIGVVKAYTTRVGEGPFPTELDNDLGQLIRDRGNEYGTVTGRPRRCGWFDAVATRYSAQLSGVDEIVVALLDVLDELDELQICEAYEINGERTTDFPSHFEDLAIAKPIYRTISGWKTDTTSMKEKSELPANAVAYADAIGEIIGVPVSFISVGPDREQTIRCQ